MRWLMIGALALVACGAQVKDTTVASGTAPTDTDTDTDADADTDTDTDIDVDTTGCEGVTPTVTVLTPGELNARLEAGESFELINVHIPYEGEIAGTDAHITFSDTDALEDYLGHDLAADAVLYCKTGPMSAEASAALVARGYCNIQDLPAGMVGWEAAGFDLLP
jgi:rhodanese-related sulfurtransferase